MFRVIKEIQHQKPKILLLIKTKQKYYQVLNKIHSQPAAMNQPFTTEEIKSAIKSLRNNASAGDDQTKAEMLKSAPDILHELLADIYNNISETGEHPPELTFTIVNTET